VIVPRSQRRTKLYNIRLTTEEDARFKRVAVLHGLDVSQALRTLIARADRERGGPAPAADRADDAWSKAHASFIKTGVAEVLERIVIYHEHVRVAILWIDKTSMLAKDSGESEIQDALLKFRHALVAFTRLDNKEREERVHEVPFVKLVLAHAEASRLMFAWLVRRNGVTR